MATLATTKAFKLTAAQKRQPGGAVTAALRNTALRLKCQRAHHELFLEAQRLIPMVRQLLWERDYLQQALENALERQAQTYWDRQPWQWTVTEDK